MNKNIFRKIVNIIVRVWGFFSAFLFRMRSHQISPPKNVSHSKWPDYLEKEFNKEGMRILEIGSRNVTGANRRANFSKATYVGFDFIDGENVDIVGDCHKLSQYFVGREKFDLIFSSAVFEHLYMPWIAAYEINKMLKVGGFVFVETHFSFSSHERPWNFFQFSDMGLRALFNGAMGFGLIEKGMSNPMAGYFGHKADRYLRYRPIPELYCHSEILCKKEKEVENFEWDKLTIDDVVDGTRYPPPNE